MKTVSADLPFLMNPHKLFCLLAGLRGGSYDRILLPDTIKYVEFWSSSFPAPPLTFHVLEQDADEGTAHFFGFQPGPVRSNDFVAAMRLLKFARDKGMVDLFPAAPMQKIGMDALKVERRFSDFYSVVLPSGTTWNFNPDLGGHTLEALIGLQLQDGVIPYFGDTEFVDYINTTPGGLRWNGIEPEVGPGPTSLVEAPEPASFEEMLFYLDNKAILDGISQKMLAGALHHQRRKDLVIIGSKAAGTTLVDTLFGIPVATAIVTGFDLVSRWIKKKE